MGFFTIARNKCVMLDLQPTVWVPISVQNPMHTIALSGEQTQI